MIKISPSVLSCDFSRLGEEVLAMEKAGADMIHLDVMDGHFVPNLSFGAPIVASIRHLTDIIFDVHLMISRPLQYAPDFIKAGANRITFHLESEDDTKETIDFILSQNVEVGLSVKPNTPVEDIFPYIDRLHQVLIMTVEPGFGGQSFMKNMAGKVLALMNYKKANGLNFDIQVDGGIDETTAPIITANGANILVAGSSLYSKPDYNKAVLGLRRAGEKGLESPLFK